jgi:hypothetical protein
MGLAGLVTTTARSRPASALRQEPSEQRGSETEEQLLGSLRAIGSIRVPRLPHGVIDVSGSQ